MDYYIMKNNVQQGPYSEEDMEAMYIANRLPGVTPVWYEGAENWMTFSATPIFETFKSSKRHTFFLMSLPIYIILSAILPIPFFLSPIIYIIFTWKEIVSAAKRLKQSDNKKYEIFLLVGSLYPIMSIIVSFVVVIIIVGICKICKIDTAATGFSTIGVVSVVLWFGLYFGIWMGLAIYSGVWKDVLTANKKINWAYKQARLLAKQQKRGQL